MHLIASAASLGRVHLGTAHTEMERTTGQYVEAALAGEHYRAFLPAPLPPVPPLDLGPEPHPSSRFIYSPTT